MKLANLDELYIAVGSNKVLVSQLIGPNENEKKEELILKRAQSENKTRIVSKNDVIVHGMEDLKVNIASCCMPIYGDEILGYITKGYGINVHRLQCPNLQDETDRVIDVSWNKQNDKRYATILMVYASNDYNLLLDIIAKTTNYSISVRNFNETQKKDDYIFEITVLVESKELLDKFIEQLKKIKKIKKIERLMR